jgi:hypothetical protein
VALATTNENHRDRFRRRDHIGRPIARVANQTCVGQQPSEVERRSKLRRGGPRRQIARPHDQITEKYLGASPMQNRRVYFDSSPVSYATTDRNRARFLFIHGTADDVVDPTTQSQALQKPSTKSASIYAGS